MKPKDRTNISEMFIGLEGSVCDLWRWALSDWKNAATRAPLSGYYVRLAVGLQNEPAPEWEYVDVRMKNGKKIEVKSTSILQPPENELTLTLIERRNSEATNINHRTIRGG